eukprot:TRINITY_DN1768_c0_g1_i1.p1 TRINITY_DN1768_c0_g1~~TRINITY_DN1768_c0_g1_i1.p1  ORF type:complete len:716 (+),score=63.40 TRINITY_DN1768_c0_g1_i1:921-3068(+)
MIDITQTQAQRFHGPKQLTLFSQQEKKSSSVKRNFYLEHVNEQLKRKHLAPVNMPKNPNSTWRGNIYKCTSILEYSRSFALNEKKNLHPAFPAMFVRSTLIPYASSPPNGVKLGNPSGTFADYLVKETDSEGTTFPPVPLSKNKDAECIERKGKICLPATYMYAGGSQTPERIKQRIIAQNQLNSMLHPIAEHGCNFQLHIQRVNMLPVPPKNPVPVLDYVSTIRKNPSKRARSSTAAKKDNVRSERPDPQKPKDTHIKSQEHFANSEVNKRKKPATGTTLEPEKIKRYSHSPNASLSSVKEKQESKKKDDLNKSTTETPVQKRPKFRPRPIKREEPPLMPERLKQKSKPVFFSEDPYIFVIMPGNNSQIIRRCMEKRVDWKEAPGFCSIFHFKWQPFSKGLRFDQISLSQKQMVNHFENHYEVTTKDGLFKNLLPYVDHRKKNVFDYVPLTFLLDVDSDTYYVDLDKFTHCYNIIDSGKKSPTLEQGLKLINQKLANFPIMKEKRTPTQCKPKLHKTHYAGTNIWILKPTGFNRGRGISVFDSLEKLKSLIKFYSEGVLENIGVEAEPAPQNVDVEQGRTSISNINNLPSIIKSRTFVIQKYIERPLLVYERKFDIRVWVLVTQELKLYFFKEGYIRTSCEKYTTSSDAIDKKNIHLTNNAVQKFCEGYGTFEDGNQLSFPQFQVFSSPKKNRNIWTQTIQKIKWICTKIWQCK